MTFDALFRPLRIRSLQLPNRIVMAPMTRSFSPGGMPSSDVGTYYRRRAEGGAGLLVTEGTAVERPAAKNDPHVPDFFGAALEAWQQVVDGVHAAGGRIAPQLWHVGATPDQRKAGWARAPIDSPSGVAASGVQDGEPMSDEAIADTIGAFARAGASARRIGFDAIELHGAHGYLIDQFLWSRVNSRADRWGGATIAERSRFAVEVVRAVRAEIGEMPLILRLSQWKIRDYDVKLAETPEQMRAWLEPLAQAGVDVFHCSQRRFWEPEFAGSDLNFAGWAKKLTGKVTLTVGSIGLENPEQRAFAGVSQWTIEEAARRIEREEFDLIAVGRGMIASPDWARKVSEGRFDELAAFDPEQLNGLG